MAIFSDLPNELILGIWDYVIEPDDVESFALVSKRIYGLSSQSLNEHARLKRQYSNIWISFREGNYEPADLLEKILLDTRIAFYINGLQIAISRPLWQWETTPQAYCKDTMSLFQAAIHASPLVTSSEEEDWITDVGKGNEDTLVALIIMQLSKIKEFSFFVSSRDEGHYLLRTLERITQLSEAAIQPKQSITGTEINGDNRITSTRPSMFFTVSYLKMGSLDMTFDMVSQLLRCIKGLKRFSYWRHRGSSFEISHLCEKLLERSQLSLQKLSLYGEDTGLGDITQFQILAELAVNFDVLLGNTDDSCRNLAEVLPMSIEVVKIFSTRKTASFQVFRRVIFDMIKCKMEHLPKLRELTFQFGIHDDEHATGDLELITDLQGMSATVGVLLTVKGELVRFEESSVCA